MLTPFSKTKIWSIVFWTLVTPQTSVANQSFTGKRGTEPNSICCVQPCCTCPPECFLQNTKHFELSGKTLLACFHFQKFVSIFFQPYASRVVLISPCEKMVPRKKSERKKSTRKDRLFSQFSTGRGGQKLAWLGLAFEFSGDF